MPIKIIEQYLLNDYMYKVGALGRNLHRPKQWTFIEQNMPTTPNRVSHIREGNNLSLILIEWEVAGLYTISLTQY